MVSSQWRDASIERFRRGDVHCSAEGRAIRSGLTVSYDLNYRGKLWTPERAQAVQEPMMKFVDVLDYD